jgi:hypothetical protein
MPETNWLRQPFETIRRAMEALEAQFGPRAGIWAYTGYASIDEIAETLWPSKDEGLGTDRAPGDEAPE